MEREHEHEKSTTHDTHGRYDHDFRNTQLILIITHKSSILEKLT